MTATVTTVPLSPGWDPADRSDAAPSWKEAAAWALGLSLVFTVFYGGSNRFAAAHGGGPGFYFGWERRLPVVPAMVIPYWSIDLPFLCSFFVFTPRRELHTHAAWFALANVMAGLFCVLLPLRFAFERPVIHGALGPLFRLLHGVDAPYNLVPSLHIADIAILWPLY